jgi:arylsulfatase A
MNRLAKLVLGLALGPGLAGAVARGEAPLNIVWIVADDLGYGDVGCYGARDIATPNLDALAQQGLRSTRFYAMPVCSPTRACLLTGLSPQATGVETALMGGGGLRADAVTAAAWLRRQGYRTALVGKWHLGYAGAALPNAQGFDEFFGHLGGKIHYYQHTDDVGGKDRPDLWENGNPVQRPGVYSTTLFTERACDFVRAQRAGPFFLMLSYNAPHYARGRKPGDAYGPDHYLQAPPEFLQRVARDPQHPTLRETYAAAVACMDDGIGRLLKTLEEEGLRDRTLVVFLSDNGADTGHGGSSGALSGHKAQLAEGGIRAALIARLPGRLPAGTVVSEPVDVRDLWPTSAALAGVPGDLPKLEGVDVAASWSGGAAPGRDRCFAWRDEKVVLRGRWKWYEVGGAQRLFDVQNDAAERHNMAGQQPGLVSELAAAWQQWSQSLQESPSP